MLKIRFELFLNLPTVILFTVAYNLNVFIRKYQKNFYFIAIRILISIYLRFTNKIINY
jgi:hypothetical protein